MNIGPALVAHPQAAKGSEPGQGALDDPAVAPQAVAALDALAGDAHLDVALGQGGTTPRRVVALVGVPLVGTLTPPPVGLADGRDRIEQLLKDHGVMAMGS